MLKHTTSGVRCIIPGMVICLLVALQSVAQTADKLEPFEPSRNAVDSYYNHLYQKLLYRFADRPLARVVVMPPFSPEYALSVEGDARGYQLKSNIKVAYYDALQQKRVVPDQPVSVSRPIDKELATKIRDLFEAALSSTGAPADPGLDGVRYFFSSYNEKYGMLRAQALTPTPGSRSGALVKICHQLIAYAKGQSNAEDSLIRNISNLTRYYESLNVKMATALN
ncbi:hypothetical protein SAMN05444266_11153 [Chitinophaga jiangningensis]|uniref:Uncharacterized protein n=1 Tax=Chitinophaga jiangningensis TaxID=1419482 RepID=A0A1M7LPK1_9BACT|nr:hypothetical protein [Chitinophaga jiangningensis]SHM79584.1 hypothetical protein SAMN05444266_11153 [Chitinophaga jiangningensis]